MSEAIPDAVQRLMALPTVGLDETADGFDVVKGFLTRFGYLPDTAGGAASGGEAGTAGVEDESANVLDEVTSMALAQYQTQHGLPASGIFDEATREMASRAALRLPRRRGIGGARVLDHLHLDPQQPHVCVRHRHHRRGGRRRA